MSDKRIYELTEASVVGADDFLALDSSEFSETKKIKTSTLTNGLVYKESLTNLIINSDTNNTGSTITKGTVFYLYGELCIALVDIASGAEFTPSTNYDNITVGGQITEIKSALSTLDSYVKSINSTYINNARTLYAYAIGYIMFIGGHVAEASYNANEWISLATLPSGHDFYLPEITYRSFAAYSDSLYNPPEGFVELTISTQGNIEIKSSTALNSKILYFEAMYIGKTLK